MSKTIVTIIGGSGYAGGELIRILLQHPAVEIRQVTSRQFANQPITVAHPNLRGQTKLTFSNLDNIEPVDILFIALPNGKSMEIIPGLEEKAGIIIDLGADYRLRSQESFESWYRPHTYPKLLGSFVYGLAELHREELKTANYIACGGCEATSINLALYPLIKEKIIQPESIIADVKIGSSAAGGRSTASSHHPERSGVLRSYKPTNHRHQAEIAQELGLGVEISATAVNLVRGILATIHTRVNPSITEKDIWKAYRSVYGSEPFIRLVKQKTGLYRYPEPKLLWGTNYADVGFELDPSTGRLVVLSAIDNLVKGTAGQAIQAMNIRLGIDETTGLEFTGLHPI